jgi:hypothetical protein
MGMTNLFHRNAKGVRRTISKAWPKDSLFPSQPAFSHSANRKEQKA